MARRSAQRNIRRYGITRTDKNTIASDFASQERSLQIIKIKDKRQKTKDKRRKIEGEEIE
jgi:hypothetical protein